MGILKAGTNVISWQVIYSLYVFILLVFVYFYTILIFVIHINYIWLFVIIKTSPPKCFPLENVPSSSKNDVVQDEEHGENIEDQVNDPMEKDDSNNIL